ncbi:transcription factor 19 [Prionailurus viverrinus]|uniref:Transcription factor 19 n=2 Tax=Felinae TaxID=338152 RepID=A0A667GV93_LYNCA|nr:transcription factor 19 [Puma concolor]XP_030170896.1 transcription factor 19 [Lynx canadensis]XP_040320772.1 transcription factor 19 [Puma yagouaroundi]XP_040320773.1 transcription factor 19 [Puma yagouaroundi]XP_047715111.1 transcription factor 19 [Prionailurus viverrinus]XP_047715112.1 transcription factor 19 [Prionailurus viverrinus]
MLPCFQLLRIGGGRGGDLYTFHPPSGAGCTYRLGCRADLCDVALQPQQEPGLISGVHAELHAERRGDDWKVSLEDHSSQGTLVNNIRLPRGHRLELSDGDLVTFGPEGSPGTSPSEFYFMFQQVRVKPQDFAAITIPRSSGEEGTRACFRPMLPPQGAPQRPLSTLSPAPKATLILNSIGSLSKLRPQPLTFSRTGGGQQNVPVPTPPREVGATPSAPPPRNRRKSAHRVLAELDDEGEMPEGSPSVFIEPRKKLRVETPPRTPGGNRRGRPRKHPVNTPRAPPAVGGGEPCAAPCCCLPEEETVAWVQCDGCDVWFHVACVGCSIQAAREADFRCPECRVGIQT